MPACRGRLDQAIRAGEVTLWGRQVMFLNHIEELVWEDDL